MKAMLPIFLAVAMLMGAEDAQAGDSVNHCISFDHYSNTLASFAINACGYKVHLYWTDDRYCANGCATTVAPGRRESITKPYGAVLYGTCRAPDLPQRTRRGFVCK